MKKMIIPAVTLFLTACGNSHKAESYVAPKPGTLVTHAEQPVAGDQLNHFNFSLKVIADTAVDSGVYDIVADFGPNNAASKLYMPKGCEHAEPVIHKGAAPNTFLVGFKLANDTTFHEYYEVSGSNESIRMKYTKAYSF